MFRLYETSVIRFPISEVCKLLLLLLLLLTAVEFSLGGSSPYTSTDKINNIHKRNSKKTQYKQYKT